MGVSIRKQAPQNPPGKPSGVRVGKTRDGRFVPIDHADAAFLAYTEHDEVPPEVLAQLGVKQATKPADKQAPKAVDKSRRSRSKKSAEVIADAGVSPEEAASAVAGVSSEGETGE